jgi:hypothetical protein
LWGWSRQIYAHIHTYVSVRHSEKLKFRNLHVSGLELKQGPRGWHSGYVFGMSHVGNDDNRGGYRISWDFRCFSQSIQTSATTTYSIRWSMYPLRSQFVIHKSSYHSALTKQHNKSVNSLSWYFCFCYIWKEATRRLSFGRV